MKHSHKITIFLVLIFICAQVAGLFVINEYIDIKESKRTGKTVVREDKYNITGIQPPPVENESYSWVYIIAAVLIGTVFVLLIIKFRTQRLWKLWFFLSVIICLSVSFAPFIDKWMKALFGSSTYSMYATVAVAGVLTIYKVFRPNIYIHNITEVFVYGGLAALIVPIIDVFSAFALLIAISLYDMFAVWKSKHMVTMAKFQTESKIFAGLMLPYKKGKLVPIKPGENVSKTKKVRSAILGGGDIAFPLLFSGVVMKVTASYIGPAIITATSALALYLLLVYGKKDKFYPAMPFISAGCFIGYAITLFL